MTLPENNDSLQSLRLSHVQANSQSPFTYPLLALILSVFAVAPLFYPGYFQTHSGFIPLWNLTDLRANPAWNWLPHQATSFDPLRSDGLLFYHLAASLPFEPVTAIKLITGLSWLMGALGLFLWLKPWLGQPGALVAALVYTYLPYRLATVYIRGAWAEALFWGILPWAIWAAEAALRLESNHASYPIEEDASQQNHKNYALRFTLYVFPLWLILGLTQLGLTLWAFIFITALTLVTQPRRGWPSLIAPFLGLALAALVTFGLSASPALSKAEGSPPHFSAHYLYPFQLLSARWGFGSSQPGWNDPLPFQLGLAAVGLTLLSLMVWLRSTPTPTVTTRSNRRMWFFIGAAGVGLCLQFGLTDGLWQVSRLANTLTYPWQLLGLVGLSLAVLAGASLRLDESLTRLPLLGGLILFIILSSYPYLQPKFSQLEPAYLAGPQTELGDHQLALLAHDFSVVTSNHTAGMEAGSAILPLAVYGPPQANQTLRLNVTWQPLQRLTENWKIFAHLVDAQNNVLAQFDGPPQAGAYPTSQWQPGELIQDSYPLTLPAAVPPGPYRVYLGLYHETTGARLPVPGDTAGRVILNVE